MFNRFSINSFYWEFTPFTGSVNVYLVPRLLNVLLFLFHVVISEHRESWEGYNTRESGSSAKKVVINNIVLSWRR